MLWYHCRNKYCILDCKKKEVYLMPYNWSLVDCVCRPKNNRVESSFSITCSTFFEESPSFYIYTSSLLGHGHISYNCKRSRSSNCSEIVRLQLPVTANSGTCWNLSFLIADQKNYCLFSIIRVDYLSCACFNWENLYRAQDLQITFLHMFLFSVNLDFCYCDPCIDLS